MTKIKRWSNAFKQDHGYALSLALQRIPHDMLHPAHDEERAYYVADAFGIDEDLALETHALTTTAETNPIWPFISPWLPQ